ncbi:MAG TPA: hypothetical protein VNI78_05135, partial [Vicinamibacterales bacterium]|nr:hypothetical protein [Vicinamibacterales bacterium]
REAVFTAVYLELNAHLQLRARALGAVTFLTDGEIDAVLRRRGPFTYDRAWEYWCHRAGRPYDPQPAGGRRGSR